MRNQTVPIGHLIREWRQRRRLSQSDLAHDAEISRKHLSSLESGRAAPDRGMVLHLAEQLTVPLRDQNIMLGAAGLAELHPERSLDDPGLRMTRRTVDFILSMHEPNPAVAIDRHWTIAASNRAVENLVSGVVSMLLTPPVNIIRLSLHPAGLAPRIINLAEWRAHLLHRLRQQIALTGDPVLLDLVAEVSGYPLLAATPPRPELPRAVAVPLRLATVHGPLAFLNTTTVFGGPIDITVAELAIEAFFPADPATMSVMRRLATKPTVAPAAQAGRTARRAAAC